MKHLPRTAIAGVLVVGYGEIGVRRQQHLFPFYQLESLLEDF